MTAPRPVRLQREVATIERRIVASIVHVPGAFACCRANGLTADLLESAAGRAVFEAVERYYSSSSEVADSDSAPPDPTLHELLGERAGYLDEFTYPYATERDQVDALRILRREHAQRASAQSIRRALSQVENGQLDEACSYLATATERLQDARGSSAPESPIDWVGTESIFEPLPPMPWISRELMIAPGRPTLVAAYGATGKTLALQSLALSVASGQKIWRRFDVRTPLRVLHLDYEQGSRDTKSRYQRLALGHSIPESELGDRLKLSAIPRVYLTSDGAENALKQICNAADLVIIDSLRAAAPDLDENSSEMRAPLDLLTRISETTGTAFIVIHHAGKPSRDGNRGDQRLLPRGSSAIFDACGCVLTLEAGATATEPKRVSMAKAPASSEGAGCEDFGLAIEDVAKGETERSGVRVTWCTPTPSAAASPANNTGYENDVRRVVSVIQSMPGCCTRDVVERAGINRSRAIKTLNTLASEGRLCVREEARNRRSFFLPEHANGNDPF
ncbi:MAG TPA: AAA family ATPase [Polyangiales bacterium]|nr:AAA family ATPase [Polyangiales bacterium]